MKYFVEIVSKKTKEVEHRIECKSEHNAEKVERGVNINLNHDKYVTRVVQDTPTELTRAERIEAAADAMRAAAIQVAHNSYRADPLVLAFMSAVSAYDAAKGAK